MAWRFNDPSTSRSTFGMPISRIASLSASIALAATQFWSRRRFTKNTRSHTRIDSVGASKPYLPPTPWYIWMRQVPRESGVQMKSDERYASNRIVAARSGPTMCASGPASPKMARARAGSSLAMNENRTRGSAARRRCTGATIT